MLTFALVALFVISIYMLTHAYLTEVSLARLPFSGKKVADAAKERESQYSVFRHDYNQTIYISATVVFVTLLYSVNWQTALGFIAGALVPWAIVNIAVKVSSFSDLKMADDATGKVAFKGSIALTTALLALSFLSALILYVSFKGQSLMFGFSFGAVFSALFIKIAASNSSKDSITVASDTSIYLALFSTAATMLIYLSGLVNTGYENIQYLPFILFAAGFVSVLLILLSAKLKGGLNRFFYLGVILSEAVFFSGAFFVFKNIFLINKKDLVSGLFLPLAFIIGATLIAVVIYWLKGKFQKNKFIQYLAAILLIILLVAALVGTYHMSGIVGVAIVSAAFLACLVPIVYLSNFALSHSSAVALSGSLDLRPAKKLVPLELISRIKAASSFIATSIVLSLLFLVAREKMFNLNQTDIFSSSILKNIFAWIGLVLGLAASVIVCFIFAKAKRKSAANENLKKTIQSNYIDSVKILILPAIITILPLLLIPFYLGSVAVIAYLLGLTLVALISIYLDLSIAPLFVGLNLIAIELLPVWEKYQFSNLFKIIAGAVVLVAISAWIIFGGQIKMPRINIKTPKINKPKIKLKRKKK